MELPNSIWRATADEDVTGIALETDVECDVLVVGAGFTGLRAAIELAERGTKVAVCEAVDIGYGASGRNGGQVNPMLPVEDPDALRNAVGNSFFERLADVSLSSADALFDLVERHNIQCDPRRSGWLRVDHWSGAREKSRRAAKAWNEFGAGFEFVDGEDLHKLTGSPIYHSAVLSMKGGAVHPLKLVRGLARVALGLGVTIFKNAPIERLSKESDRWIARSRGNSLKSNAVVLATNGYTGQLIPGLRNSVMTFNPIQIATDPLDEAMIAGVLPGGHTISDTRRLIMYARREPDNRFVFGGTGYPNLIGKIGGYRWLLHDVKKIFPSLRSVGFKYKWGGKIALTVDKIPHLHEPEAGLIAGLGYNGRGVAMSLVMGKVMADRVLGAAPETLPFPITDIQGFPFGKLQSTFAGVGMHWLRWTDQREAAKG